MIQVIAGKRGSGKTKRILSATNEASKNPSNVVVFVDYDNKHIHDLDREVRFVNAGEFEIVDDKMLLGFFAGMLTQNYDINNVCIDGFKKLIKTDLNKTEWFFTRLEELGNAYKVCFTMTVSEDIDLLPEYIKKHVI